METETVSVIRKALLAILALGLAGTAVELVLLKHTDGAWQLIPIVLLGIGVGCLVWYMIAASAAALRGLRVLMFLYLVSGVAGVVLHFIGNVGYARESNPSLTGWGLYTAALAGSTPSLAPGTMIQLALVGLAFLYRHPGLSASTNVKP